MTAPTEISEARLGEIEEFAKCLSGLKAVYINDLLAAYRDMRRQRDETDTDKRALAHLVVKMKLAAAETAQVGQYGEEQSGRCAVCGGSVWTQEEIDRANAKAEKLAKVLKWE
jgi:hypothetical protein